MRKRRTTQFVPPPGLKRIRVNGKWLWDWASYYKNKRALNPNGWELEYAARLQNQQVYGREKPDTVRRYSVPQRQVFKR